MSDPLLASLEQKYQLPPGILGATEHVESHGRDLTSDAGAQGHFQLMPETARKLGVNPHDRTQAAEGAARLWAENLKAANGDVDQAAMLYHAGPDRKGWGPKTHAYPGKILAALSGGAQSPAQPAPAPVTAAPPDPNDPFESALAGGAPSGGNDPFEAALAGDKTAPDAGPLPQAPADAAGNNGDQAGPDIPVGTVQPAPGSGRPSTGGIGASLGDFANGVSEGWGNLQADIVGLGARATDALGISHGELDRIDKARAALKAGTVDPMFNNPDGWSRPIGEFTGQMIGSAPLTELKPFEALGAGGKIGKALNRYLDMSAQGAAFGTIGSGGHDIESNAALGAALAPVLGKGIEYAAKPVIAAAQKLGAPASELNAKMSDALRKRYSDFPEVAPAPSAEAPKWAGTMKPPEGIPAVNEEGAPFVGMGKAGGQEYPRYGEAPKSAETTPALTQQQLADALGNRSAKQGIEATRDLPKAVADDYQRLKDQGVPDGEALREADIRAVGAKPTVGAVKRSPDDMSAMFEGAKQPTPEGRALSQQLADNNAALHSHVQSMVEANGGVPAQGEAAQTAAISLAKASDAAKAKVTAAYDAARSAEGDKPVSIDAVRELLASPEFKAPTTAEGKQLVAGLKAQIGAMAKENGGRFTPDQIEQLNQAASRAYNPMGGGGNHMVGQVKKALNESLDQLDNAGPLYKQARAAHRDWAKQYDDPAGISRLTARDAEGNFLNEDNWRAAEGIIGSTGDKQFIQITRQLAKNGDTEALGRLKASVLQRAYERASNNAADRSGNATLNAKAWFAELNKIGMPKLKALFTPEEIASLAHVGRVAVHMNEAIPGTVNTSNTASALVKALGLNGEKPASRPILSAVGKGMKYGAHIVAGHAMPGVGNAGIELTATAAKKVSGAHASRASAKELAAALREQMDPQSARAAETAATARSADAARRKAQARILSQRLAAPSSQSRSH